MARPRQPEPVERWTGDDLAPPAGWVAHTAKKWTAHGSADGTADALKFWADIQSHQREFIHRLWATLSWPGKEAS